MADSKKTKSAAKKPKAPINIYFFANQTRTYWLEILFLLMGIVMCAVRLVSTGINFESLYYIVLTVIAAYLLTKCKPRELFVKITQQELLFSEHVLKGFIGSMHSHDIQKIEFSEYTAVTRKDMQYIGLIRFHLENGQEYELSEFVSETMRIELRKFCRVHGIKLVDVTR